MNGSELGKLLIVLGLGAILLGLVIMALSKFISLGHLPGDIFIKRRTRQLLFSHCQLYRVECGAERDSKSLAPLESDCFRKSYRKRYIPRTPAASAKSRGSFSATALLFSAAKPMEVINRYATTKGSAIHRLLIKQRAIQNQWYNKSLCYCSSLLSC